MSKFRFLARVSTKEIKKYYCAPIVAALLLLHSFPSYAQTPPQPEQPAEAGISEEFPKLKMSGEALLGIGYSGVIPAPGRADSKIIFDSRLRLKIVTEFSPDNVLTVRFEKETSPPLNSSVTGTNMTRSGYDGFKNDAVVGWVKWRVKCGERTTCIFEPIGSSYNGNFETFNPELGDSATGSMSRFGRYAPIFRLSKDSGGFTIQHRFTDQLSVTTGHTVGSLIPLNTNDPFAPFNGANSSLIQLKYEPSKEFKIGLTVGRSYHPTGVGVSGSTGSQTANNPANGEPTTALHYALGSTYQISKDVSLSGSVGMSNSQTTNGQKNDQSTNASLSLAVKNFGGKGNMLGIIVGIPPKSSRDRDTSLHLEGIYNVKVSDRLNITPGVLVITNPEHNGNNAPIVMATIRTSWTW
jgi:Carbohydrate-selective porin, OprB family